MNEPLNHKVKDINGSFVDLNQYKGKTILIVNVASKCGLTPQYKGLQELYDKYKDRGFIILGFPANDFMGQEPGTEADIKMKVKKGEGQSDLYKYLTSKETSPGFEGDIEWNFQKFLVDNTGKTVKRYSPKTTPEEIAKELEKYL